MRHSRRVAMLSWLVSPLAITGQEQDDRKLPIPDNPDEERRLPDGRSQKNAIAKQSYQEVLKEADDLITAAQQLKDELQKAGQYVVPVSSVKKTEEIEKLARRIRGHLK
jgi:hypothetical protein